MIRELDSEYLPWYIENYGRCFSCFALSKLLFLFFSLSIDRSIAILHILRLTWYSIDNNWIWMKIKIARKKAPINIENYKDNFDGWKWNWLDISRSHKRAHIEKRYGFQSTMNQRRRRKKKKSKHFGSNKIILIDTFIYDGRWWDVNESWIRTSTTLSISNRI